ncbi:peptidylprolyl isomerase [Candidatus Micrarchaeota archaeon]|nr:peptidylprolyl isomerase [Candidatus Micrarchaeota archaeon]
MSDVVKVGNTVSVDYLGTLKDGTVFDTSIQAEAEKAALPERPTYEPLVFQVGSGQVIKGFDDAVIGMKVGDTKTVEIPSNQAYGEKRDDLLITVPLSQLEENNITAEVGLVLSTPNGLQGTILEVNQTDAKIDFNHPLAGQTLVFKITLKKIN